MSRVARKSIAAVFSLALLTFFALGCGPLDDMTWIGDEGSSEGETTQVDANPQAPAEQIPAKPRDSRLAEGEIYRVRLQFGDAMLDGGWYSVILENPRNNWRDVVQWNCNSLAEYEEEYRFYEFPFHSQNFNAQEPATMDGEYLLFFRNGFGFERMETLTWRDGQFIDGGYAEYSVP